MTQEKTAKELFTNILKYAKIKPEIDDILENAFLLENDEYRFCYKGQSTIITKGEFVELHKTCLKSTLWEGHLTNSQPILFSIKSDELTQQLNKILKDCNVINSEFGVSKRVWVSLPENKTAGRSAGRLIDNLSEPEIKTGILEFLGFSKIDNSPIFIAYRIYELSHEVLDQNTFGNETVLDAFKLEGAKNGHIGTLIKPFEIKLVSFFDQNFTGLYEKTKFNYPDIYDFYGINRMPIKKQPKTFLKTAYITLKKYFK